MHVYKLGNDPLGIQLQVHVPVHVLICQVTFLSHWHEAFIVELPQFSKKTQPYCRYMKMSWRFLTSDVLKFPILSRNPIASTFPLRMERSRPLFPCGFLFIVNGLAFIFLYWFNSTCFLLKLCYLNKIVI